MAQQQHAADVHPDELYPPNKRYNIMDANKKINFEHVQCPPESKILTNIIKNHPLRFNIAASSFVPWIYIAQFWHTLKEDESKATIGRNSLFSSSCNIFDSLSKIYKDHHWEIQRQSWNEDSSLDDLRRDEAHRALSDVCEAPMPIVDKADELILQDTLQISLAEQRSQEEQEARENVALVNEHLASVEIEKMVKGQENVIDDCTIPRNDDHNIPNTRLEPRSDKESLEVEITNDKVVEITKVVIPINVNEEEEETTDEVYELKRRQKRKVVEEFKSTPFPTPIRSPRIHTNLVSLDTKKLQELMSFDTLVDHLREVMVDSLPNMVDTLIKEQVNKKVPEQVQDQVPVYVTEGLIMERQKNKEEMERMIAKAILQERGIIQAEISLKIQKTIDSNIPSQVDASVRSYMSGNILHVHPVQSQKTSILKQQYQLYLSMKDDPQWKQQVIAIWLALQMKFKRLQGKNSAKRQKTFEYKTYVSGESSSGQVNEEEQGPSTLECRKEIIVSPYPRKTTPLVQSCQRDPEAPTLSLINQYLLYLKKGSSGPEKIVLSLHKFPAVIFNDDDIKLDGRANECVVSIIKPDFKNINKNDIEDMYLLIVNGKVPDYAETGLLWSLSELKSMKCSPSSMSLCMESYISIARKRKGELLNDEVEYLKLFEEEIEVRLKYRNKMRRREMVPTEDHLFKKYSSLKVGHLVLRVEGSNLLVAAIVRYLLVAVGFVLAASESVADKISSSQRKRREAYARLYKKVIDLSKAREIEYGDVVSSVSEEKKLDSVSMNSTPSWSSPSTSGSIEAVINNNVLLLRTMLQWEEQLRSEAGKLADVNNFREITVVSWPDGDILRLRSGSTAANAATRVGQMIYVSLSLLDYRLKKDLRKPFPSLTASPSLHRAFPLMRGGSFPLSELGRQSCQPDSK
nr:hypothetical protein [Tanacetum cinerariifolium]